MLIEVPDSIAAQLQKMADKRHITVGQMVDILIRRDACMGKHERSEWAQSNPQPVEAPAPSDIQPGDEGWPPPGSLAALAENARRANLGSISSQKTDTSARSREILNAEFAEYIRRNCDW